MAGGGENGNTCHLGMKEVDVNNNGCDFVVHATATAGEGAVEGKLDIVCPENNVMDFQVTSNPVCHLTIPAQANLGTLTYTNHPMAKDVDLDFNIDVDLDFNIVELFCRLDNNCPAAGNHANGTYRGISTLKADNEGAETSFGVD